MPRRKEVDAWLTRYKNPMKPVVQRIRELVLAADPRVDECIKWQAPTFTFAGNLASFFPRSKSHASLMFHLGAHIPGTHPRLEGTGGTGRVLKVGSVADANAAKGDVERVVRAWCEWRVAMTGPLTEAEGESTRMPTPKRAAKVTGLKKQPKAPAVRLKPSKAKPAKAKPAKAKPAKAKPRR